MNFITNISCPFFFDFSWRYQNRFFDGFRLKVESKFTNIFTWNIILLVLYGGVGDRFKTKIQIWHIYIYLHSKSLKKSMWFQIFLKTYLINVGSKGRRKCDSDISIPQLRLSVVVDYLKSQPNAACSCTFSNVRKLFHYLVWFDVVTAKCRDGFMLFILFRKI